MNWPYKQDYGMSKCHGVFTENLTFTGNMPEFEFDKF